MENKNKNCNMKKEIVIKVRVDSEMYEFLNNKRQIRELGNVTNQALEFYKWYLLQRKGFFIMLIQEHFEEMKHLLRKIGRSMK
jgi:hypothetical protein